MYARFMVKTDTKTISSSGSEQLHPPRDFGAEFLRTILESGDLIEAFDANTEIGRVIQIVDRLREIFESADLSIKQHAPLLRSLTGMEQRQKQDAIFDLLFTEHGLHENDWDFANEELKLPSSGDRSLLKQCSLTQLRVFQHKLHGALKAELVLTAQTPEQRTRALSSFSLHLTGSSPEEISQVTVRELARYMALAAFALGDHRNGEASEQVQRQRIEEAFDAALYGDFPDPTSRTSLFINKLLRGGIVGGYCYRLTRDREDPTETPRLRNRIGELAAPLRESAPDEVLLLHSQAKYRPLKDSWRAFSQETLPLEELRQSLCEQSTFPIQDHREVFEALTPRQSHWSHIQRMKYATLLKRVVRTAKEVKASQQQDPESGES